MNRILLVLVCILGIASGCEFKKEALRPNIVLVMADDLGYGDVAYMGNKTVLTPYLDEMATLGVRLNRFYAAAPVCSPTRASCLTGRHPYRTGIKWAGQGRIEPEEITLAEALRTVGYRTGHFGKWHVGGLSKTIKQGYFDENLTLYSPPWENGFDVCFSTESMMPTYNPYYQVGGAYGSKDYKFVQDSELSEGQDTGGFTWRDYYWTQEDEYLKDPPAGEDSRLIMSHALRFIKECEKSGNPFFTVIWFHAVHTPVSAGKSAREPYSNLSMPEQHWYGCISSMDKEIGRLRQELKAHGLSDNTIIWFCSDNGPSYIHNYNSAGPLRGKKAELTEGGIRVPAIIEWPSKLKESTTSELPMSTSDIYPTILDICGIEVPCQPLLDGRSIWQDIYTGEESRGDLIFFQSPLPGRMKEEPGEAQQLAAIGDRYKILSIDNGHTYQLYELDKDIHEETDLSEQYPEIKEKMVMQLEEWVNSFNH